jgi:hypothetical protein
MQLTNGQKLQEGYRRCIEPYSDWLQIAVTLTLKTRTKIRVKRFENLDSEFYEFWTSLDEEKLNSTINYFTAQLRHEIFGNKAKHKNKRHWAAPLVITAIEGKNNNKRIHLHLAIGNIPSERLSNIEVTIKRLWRRCDFANKQTVIKKINNSYGWLEYITKEVGYTNNDALDIVASTIPRFIQESICTESRLQTA